MRQLWEVVDVVVVMVLAYLRRAATALMVKVADLLRMTFTTEGAGVGAVE
jgi:hypothetical protein